jgi:hypothetical protein
MKTKTYDLNLYVLDGILNVYAYELQVGEFGDISTNYDKFIKAFEMPVLRGNERLWKTYLDYFGEKQIYSELDSWKFCMSNDFDTPNEEYQPEELRAMPVELALALSELPEYEVK